jgi:hypothetical protein
MCCRGLEKTLVERQWGDNTKGGRLRKAQRKHVNEIPVKTTLRKTIRRTVKNNIANYVIGKV